MQFVCVCVCVQRTIHSFYLGPQEAHNLRDNKNHYGSLYLFSFLSKELYHNLTLISK